MFRMPMRAIFRIVLVTPLVAHECLDIKACKRLVKDCSDETAVLRARIQKLTLEVATVRQELAVCKGQSRNRDIRRSCQAWSVRTFIALNIWRGCRPRWSSLRAERWPAVQAADGWWKEQVVRQTAQTVWSAGVFRTTMATTSRALPFRARWATSLHLIFTRSATTTSCM